MFAFLWRDFPNLLAKQYTTRIFVLQELKESMAAKCMAKIMHPWSKLLSSIWDTNIPQNATKELSNGRFRIRRVRVALHISEELVTGRTDILAYINIGQTSAFRQLDYIEWHLLRLGVVCTMSRQSLS